MFYQQKQYIKFLLKATNQHGVHSPFVYNLVTKCIYKKTDRKLWFYFKTIKQHLLDNKQKIKVTDFGAGSKYFKTNERKISEIAKVAGISNKKAKLLIHIINYFKPAVTLEVGTSLGLATSAIKIGNNSTKITTLEGCRETSKIASELLNNNFKNINIITGNFNETLPEISKKNKYDFIYFDGNHTKKSTLKYFNTCLKTSDNNSMWIFDDIYWSKDMQEAWMEIKNNPAVTVTVDLFYFGIVFFRKEQAKEHFKIRV
ncbi:class I SAM-dependent methyltransferase [Polaribacter aestuariivivens]|uniref:Class I SAM-dependent methyltransferase n=1 Tax=Polaribacter aestuariivivens TaxID=2304626 RepID=A0A5S3N6T6_9FLAO|nr:class I SAM-dependent methyltransferase [Polaribacter aestuariivivens]TMM31041.1 class I SAM-dependent methyltransferase [Polaribacter aestuariivivens]